MRHPTGHPTPAPPVQRLGSRAKNAKAARLERDLDDMRAVLGRTDSSSRKGAASQAIVTLRPMCTKTGGGVSSRAARTQSSIVLRLVFAKKSDIERLIAWLGEIGYGEARAAEAQIQNLDEEKLAVEVAIHGQSDPVWLRPCNGLAQGFAADPDAVARTEAWDQAASPPERSHQYRRPR